MTQRNPLNRRTRTRIYGGVAGESGRPLPLCRFSAIAASKSGDDGDGVCSACDGAGHARMPDWKTALEYCSKQITGLVAIEERSAALKQKLPAQLPEQ
jgi:hypothetical protein